MNRLSSKLLANSNAIHSSSPKTPREIKGSTLIAISLAALILGLGLGMAWSKAQESNRDNLCREHGEYCSSVHPNPGVKVKPEEN